VWATDSHGQNKLETIKLFKPWGNSGIIFFQSLKGCFCNTLGSVNLILTIYSCFHKSWPCDISKKNELKTLLSCISCNSQPIAMIPFVNLDFWSFWRCLGCQINVNTAASYYIIFLVIINSLQLVQSIRHVRHLVFVPEIFQICILRCKDVHNDLKCRCTVGFG
jgi:hypothetical protein